MEPTKSWEGWIKFPLLLKSSHRFFRLSQLLWFQIPLTPRISSSPFHKSKLHQWEPVPNEASEQSIWYSLLSFTLDIRFLGLWSFWVNDTRRGDEEEGEEQGPTWWGRPPLPPEGRGGPLAWALPLPVPWSLLRGEGDREMPVRVVLSGDSVLRAGRGQASAPPPQAFLLIPTRFISFPCSSHLTKIKVSWQYECSLGSAFRIKNLIW